MGIIVDIPAGIRSYLEEEAAIVVNKKKDRYWGDTLYPDRDRIKDKYRGWCGEWAVKEKVLGVPFKIEDIKKGDGGIDFWIGEYSGQIKTTRYPNPAAYMCFYPWDKRVAKLYVGVCSAGKIYQDSMAVVEVNGWIWAKDFKAESVKIDFVKSGKNIPDCYQMIKLSTVESMLALLPDEPKVFPDLPELELTCADCAFGQGYKGPNPREGFRTCLYHGRGVYGLRPACKNIIERHEIENGNEFSKIESN